MPRGEHTVGPAGIPGWVTDDHLTPRDLVESLGPFTLDPCASIGQPWPTADVMWTVRDDGLAREWPREAFIFCNPPYRTSGGVWVWLQRLADHGGGIGLLFARTDAKGFARTVWGRATALYFFRQRIYFRLPGTGERARCNGGAPSVLALYGEEAVRRAERLLAPGSDYPGELVRLKPPPMTVKPPPAKRRRGR